MLPLITDEIDVAVNPATGDIPAFGDLSGVTGIAAVVQGASIRLRMVAGEWFLNLAQGVRYLVRPDGSVTQAQALLGSKFDPLKAIQEFRDNLLGSPERGITGVPGLLDVPVLNADFDNLTRVLTVTWQASTAFGNTQLQTLAIPIAGQVGV